MSKPVKLRLLTAPLPCPFCGCEGADFDPNLPGMVCDGCGASGPACDDSCNDEASDEDLESVALGLWNKREAKP